MSVTWLTPVRVEKVGEVGWFRDCLLYNINLTHYRKRKRRIYPTSATFATRDGIGLLSVGP